nr:hypothetical protein [Comamonas jiangduensis]
MPGTQHLPFRHKLLTIAILATLPSSASWALELVQEPPLPTSKSAFVAPNVIISVDDSGVWIGASKPPVAALGNWKGLYRTQ